MKIVRRKDNKVGAAVMKPVRWAVMGHFGLASVTVIVGRKLCAPGSNFTDENFGTLAVNELGWVSWK